MTTITLFDHAGRAITRTPQTGFAPTTAPAIGTTPRRDGTPKPCACNCGGMTRGGTWMPGHDAKHAKATGQHANAGWTAPKADRGPKECACGCKGITKGGTWLPGHDARNGGHKARIGDTLPQMG